jgi:uncharacterized delta-60 repeat protein
MRSSQETFFRCMSAQAIPTLLAVSRRFLAVLAAWGVAGSPGLVHALAPAAPTNVMAKTTRVISDGAVYWLVTWDDNALDEAGYLVKGRYFSGGRDVGPLTQSNNKLIRLDANATSAIILEPDLFGIPDFPNISAQFTVTAFKNNGTATETSSGGTSPRVLTLADNTFGVPTGVAVTKVAGSDGSYQISFEDKATTEIYYRLQFKRSADSLWSESNEFQLGLFGETSVRRAIQLIPGTSYDFRMRAERFNQSFTLYSVPIVTLTTEPLSAPTELSVVAVDDDKVRLKWKDNSTNTMGYEMQYKFVGSTDPFVALSGGSGTVYAGGDDTEYEVTVGPGTEIEWRVRGVFQDSSNTLYYSTFSNTATVSTQFPAPTNVEVVATGLSGSIAVKWLESSEYTSQYEIVSRDAETEDAFATLATVPVSAKETLITGLTPDEAVEVAVRAMGSGGASFLSQPVTVTPKHGFDPSAYVFNLDASLFGRVLLTPLNAEGNAANEVIRGVAFSHTLAVTDSGNVTSRALDDGRPPGIVLANSALGLVNGTPTTAGVFNCVATVSYTGGHSAVANLVFRVQQPPTAPVAGVELPDRTIGLSAPLTVDLASAFSDPDTSRAAQFTTTLGNIKMSLFQQVTPQAVANFMAYVNGGDYDGVAFHRSFRPGDGPNDAVGVLQSQPGGGFIAGGSFTSFNGSSSSRVVGVKADGTIDPVFSVGSGANGEVRDVAMGESGKVFIAGDFLSYKGTSRPRIALIGANGTVDSGFVPGSGADAAVHSVVALPGGKALIGGNFLNYNGTGIVRIARLNANGSRDITFDPGTGPNGLVRKVIALPGDKVLIGGDFTSYNGISRAGLAQLNSDGTLDMSFDPGTGVVGGSLLALARADDGDLMIGGGFTEYNGTPRAGLARLNDDGSLDASFDPGTGPNGLVHALVVLTGGKTIIGGEFTEFRGFAAGRIARLESNGELDLPFNTGSGADDTVSAISVLSDGKVAIGGSFTEFNGIDRSYLVRLTANGSFDSAFNPGFVVQGGGFKPVEAPDKFETVDSRPSPRNEPGVGNYRGIVAAAKVGGDPNSATHDFFLNLGDNSANLDLQNNGFTAFGRITGSGLEVMDAISALPTRSYSAVVDGATVAAAPDGLFANFPVLAPAPTSMDISKAVKILDAFEIPPLTYAVTGNTASGVVGATVVSGQLQLTGVSEGSADVTVTATDLDGNTVAQTMTIQVVTEQQAVAIQTQPQSQAVPGMTNVTFSVVATGTDLQYQWRRNGSALVGKTASSLLVENVDSDKAGVYDVVVSNASNSMVSAPATLAITEGASVEVQPVPRIVLSGQPLSLTVGLNGVPVPAVTWTKDTRPLTVTGPILTVASTALSDAGNYRATVTNATGTEQTSIVPVVVVDGTARRLVVKNSATVTMSVVTRQPAGTVLSYQWKDKNGANVTGNRFSGMNTARLTVRGVSINNDVGGYRCQVSAVGIGTILSGEFDLVVGSTPEVSNFVLPDAFVAQDYAFQVPFDDSKPRTPTKFTATGLPSGLVINSVTGQISGRPIRRGNHTVSVVASNPAGTSARKTATLRVIPMPSNTTGVYIGLLARQALVNRSCGGRVDLTISDTGAYTGKVFLPGKTHSITGRVTRSETVVSSQATTLMTGVTTLKETGKPDQVFTFLVNANNGEISGELVLNGTNKSGLTGWKNVWHATYRPASAVGLTGTYHFAMDIPTARVGDLTVPQGSGYGALTVSNSGIATIKGRTIDNKSVVCSGALGPAGSFMVFQQLSNKTGSLQGPLAIAQRDADLVDGLSHSEIVTVPGFAFDQFKNPAPGTRDYPAGIAPAVALTVMGGTYSKPTVSARNVMTRLTKTGGAVDTGFNQNLLADNTVLKIAKQLDGKLLLVGVFSRFGGVSRNGIVRVSAAGALDELFNPGTGANGAIFDVAIQSDGKIVIVGAFTQFNGVARNRVARLNADGTLDTTYNVGTGPNATVECVALQTVGAEVRVVIGGQFGAVSGSTRSGVARLLTTGAVDTTFNNGGTGTNGIVRCVAVDSLDRVLIGGDFTTYRDSANTHARSRIARLNSNGALETAFAASANGTVRAIVVQTDQRILVGGNFSVLSSNARSFVGRILQNGGGIDSSFVPGVRVSVSEVRPVSLNGEVRSIAVFSDGKIAIGGVFSRLFAPEVTAAPPLIPTAKPAIDVSRNGIAIFDSAGTLDDGFNPPSGGGANENNSVRTLVEQGDNLLVGGWVRLRTAGPRVMWLTDTKNDATVSFSQGKLATAPITSPGAVFDISTSNRVMAQSGNTGGVTWSYSSSTGIVSGQFSPDQTGTKRIAKYTGLLIPVTPSDIRGMGSFDLPELPNGTTITTKNAPIFTGKVLISPEP